MLIKSADDQSAHIAALERTAAGKGPEARRATEELRIRRAGLKGERESAYLIDFDFANARNWIVLHDLRLEHDGRTAQIDHVMVNRLLEVYVLESKHFRDGMKITDEGEFLRWNGYKRTYEGMASPLSQNERHIAVLREVMTQLDLPLRMGLRMVPSFATLILVAPGARIDRPTHFDTSRIIKADQLKRFLEKDIEGIGMLKLAKVVSSETLEELGRQLAAQHRAMDRCAPKLVQAQSSQRSPHAKPQLNRKEAVGIAGPVCKDCQTIIGEILHGRYGYYFKCGACGTNTAIRFTCQPGHAPRLRKERADFFRECADCGTSILFHSNLAG